jgi:hypothetical protein
VWSARRLLLATSPWAWIGLGHDLHYRLNCHYTVFFQESVGGVNLPTESGSETTLEPVAQYPYAHHEGSALDLPTEDHASRN